MMAIPSIDMEATGRNITRLRQQAGLTVRDSNWTTNKFIPVR